ncbi:MAG: 3-phosphoshikimate 1-carboxyvinyltransferase [Thermoplasmata archaeon]|nr:3-phosphoshikimate 1-carboxyvinyltransferase [Thermoplasmata archaeon]
MIIESVEEVRGRIDAPPSKSYTHRAFFTGFISGEMEVKNPLRCDDTEATIEVLRMLGAKISWGGIEYVNPHPGRLSARKSGATARFSLGVSSQILGTTLVNGSSQLRRRPMGALLNALRELGVEIRDSQGYLPVIVKGKKIKKNSVKIDASISSQFVSSLLFLGAKKGEFVIEVKNLVSKGYVDMTIEVLKEAGAKISMEEDRIYVEQGPKGGKFHIPGDYSSASFFLVAGAIFGKVKVENLRKDFQPDARIVDILEAFGAKVRRDSSFVEVMQGDLHGGEVDCRNHPDLFPILAVLGAYSKGTTVLKAPHLRYKESDRIRSMVIELRKMGADIKELRDGVLIQGGRTLRGGILDSHGDHRIAMALSIAALGAKGRSMIIDERCVEKSYPQFFRDLRRIAYDG